LGSVEDPKTGGGGFYARKDSEKGGNKKKRVEHFEKLKKKGKNSMD